MTAVPVFLFIPWSSPATSVRWLALCFAVFTLVFELIVKHIDTTYKFGGILSIKKWLDIQRRNRDTNAPKGNPPEDPQPQSSPEESERLRTNLNKERLSITTGFAAILGFQMVSALRLWEIDLDFSEKVLLTALSGSFVLVCLSNLVELGLHTLLGQSIWKKDEKGELRHPLGFLMALSNRLLILGVILLLSLLPHPWPGFPL